jgi:hypothetical protein
MGKVKVFGIDRREAFGCSREEKLSKKYSTIYNKPVGLI